MVYFVATPIGNLKDITYRAIEVLSNVDVIACEDTRNTLKLLNHYNIKKKLISYHKFNENSRADELLEIAKTKNVAIVSDAGMPLISDPGGVLVKKLKEENVEFTIIGGVSASLCALVLSGIDNTSFTFVGFIKEEKREEFVKRYKNYKTTLIFYISPHSLEKDLDLIYKVLGKRKACLVKEISKIHETAYNFTLGEEIDIPLKGEFVLVIEGDKEEKALNQLDLDEHIKFYLDLGMDKKDALKKVAKERNLSKSQVYKETLHNSTK